MAGFQTQVYPTLALGVAGDFADHNPRFSYMAGSNGGLVAGAVNGLTVGNFAWVSSSFIDTVNAPAVANNFGAGTPAGIVPRFWQGTNSTFLSPASMFIPGGYAVAIYSGGGFFVVNSGSGQALVGMNAYANLATGAVTFASGAAAASTVTAATSAVTAGSSSVTGSIQGNVLTVTAVGSGTLYAGTTLSGTNVASGTEIVSQLSGTTGGVGTYAVSIAEQSAASTTITGAYGILTLGATPSGAFTIGALVTGTGISTTVFVRQLIAGTPSTSGATYSVDGTTSVGSTTLTFTTNVSTNWIARSSGNTGELVKISNVPNT